MLASVDLQIPSKYFALARCFRYDVVDATHLPDFNQAEVIIVEEGLTLRHLFGLLEMFAKEFDLIHISIGDIFRWNIQSHTKLAAHVKRIIAEGKLVSDDIVE